MAHPRFCTNPGCEYSRSLSPRRLVRDGLYHTRAHGTVQRYRCTGCGRRLSAQSESIHYFAKRRLDLKLVFTRLRGGSSMRDIARSLGCSTTAISNAVLRLGRQAMAAHLSVIPALPPSSSLCFDGLVSAVRSRDYPCQITTLADSDTELLLAMTHCVTERGGNRTPAQEKRIARHRARWRPPRGALSQSITLLVHELSRFASPLPSRALRIDTDEHPLYPPILDADPALGFFRRHAMLEVRRTPGSAPRTADNPLFVVNYLDRMIRHRLKEHTRESIALGANAAMQMHRMWLFAWDHNGCQPKRVAKGERRNRLECAGIPAGLSARLRREFFSRRFSVRNLLIPESIRQVWCAKLIGPPPRRHTGHHGSGPSIPAFALRDLSFASHPDYLHAR